MGIYLGDCVLGSILCSFLWLVLPVDERTLLTNVVGAWLVIVTVGTLSAAI